MRVVKSHKILKHKQHGVSSMVAQTSDSLRALLRVQRSGQANDEENTQF